MTKNYFSLMLSAVVWSFSASAQPVAEKSASFYGDSSFISRMQSHFSTPDFARFEKQSQLSRAESDEQLVHVTYCFIYDSNIEAPYSAQYLFHHDGELPPQKAMVNNGVVEFDVPPGRYDMCATFNREFSGTVMVTKDNINIDCDAVFEFDTSDATIHLEFVPLMPDGSEMRLPRCENNAVVDEGNMKTIIMTTMFSHPTFDYYSNTVGVNGSFNDENGNSIDMFRCGDAWFSPTDVFQCIYAFDGVTAQNDEIATAISVPIDKSIRASNDISCYSTYNLKYVTKDIKSAGDEINTDIENYLQYGLYNPMSHSWISWEVPVSANLSDKHIYGFPAISADKKQSFCMGLPVKYNTVVDDYYELGVRFPAFGNIDGEPWNIVSQAIPANESPTLRYYGYDSSDCLNLLPNMQFSFPYQDNYIYGNCCPTFIPGFNLFGQFSYSFVGRAGELCTSELLDADLSVKVDGDEKINSWMDLVLDNYFSVYESENESTRPMDITAVYKGYNIDNAMPACGQTKIHLDRADGISLPVMQILQLRDLTNNVTDRFDTPEHGYVMFAAGVYNPEEYTYIEPQNVIVEWAPYQSNKFREMSYESDDEVGFMHNYGWLYRADLSQIPSETSHGWHDLRITLEGSDGSFMQQTISPAFCIGEADLPQVMSYGSFNDGPVEYYNLQGLRISEPISGQPVICRQNSSVTKILKK